ANQGISVARNRAIGISSGEYIALLDSDDVWFPEKLELQVKVLEAREAVGMVYSDCIVVDSLGHLLRRTYMPQTPPQGMIFRDLLLSNCIPSSSAMMRKKVFQETGLFNPAYRIAMDYDLWLRLAVRYPIEAVQKPLMQYRLHMGGISSNRAEMIREDLEIMEKWLQEKPNLRNELSEGILQKQRTFHYHLFLHHLHSMEPWKASRSFLSWLALGFHRTPGRRSEVR
ncbi:MAG: glycosyltransferase, partial [Methanoregulaceae archaeon]|nr:glycosyltransferase [Methanoregulaceae archaeon]